ncbi:MAG: hypothetical protein ACK50A_00055 [Sphingobacteriaceae bacterium]|jgi:hypothetical protein
MERKEILEQLASLESVYGLGARKYLNDLNLGKQFICECYESIREDRASMEKHFGITLVKKIVTYAEVNCED